MDVAGILGGRQRGLDIGSHCRCGWGICGWYGVEWTGVEWSGVEWDHPEASARAYVATDNSAATIHNGASDLGEGDGTASIAYCNNGQEGVQCKARDDVGISGSGWQHGEIKSASVH